MANISEGLVLVSSDTRPDNIAQMDGDGAKKAAPKKAARGNKDAGARNRAAQDEGNVGQVLRTVYQRTVDEAIPSEMLDLLRKLG